VRWFILSVVGILTLQTVAVAGPGLRAQTRRSGNRKLLFQTAIPREGPGGLGIREELAKGKFLIAGRRLLDPNFRETVVVLVEYGPGGAMGLVINRPSDVKLSTMFPDIKELKERKDTIYVGGPVAVNQMMLLTRSLKTPEQSTQVIEDVYFSTSWKLLERLMKKEGKNESYRLFAGYAGWSPSQLDFERTRGDWYVVKADAEMIFSQNPSEIWPELIRRATVKWVDVQVPPYSASRQFREKSVLSFHGFPHSLE
jgi:putative transcriptional regulator